MDLVLKFDPASLSIWYAGFPVRDGEVDILGGVAEPALRGQHGVALQLAQAIPDGPRRLRAAHVFGSVVHEQRHFVDVLLTNYGQSILRQFTALAVNVPSVLGHASSAGRLGVPVTVYGDRVRRRLAGVVPTDELDRIARDVRDRERMAREDMESHALPGGRIMSFGGRAQLEALGYFTQAVLIQREFGAETAVAWQSDVPDRERFRDQYLWAATLGASLGLTAPDPGPADAIPVLAPAVSALLYGALMIRRWGQEQTVVDGGHSAAAGARLAPLVGELRASGALNAADSTETAWQAVDAACARLFGRSATAELEHDLEREARFIDSVEAAGGAANPVCRYFRGLQAARRRLVERFATDPGVVVDPLRYSELVRLIQPVPIFAHLAGAEPDQRPGWQPLWPGQSRLGELGTISWIWGSAPLDEIRAGDRIHVVADPEAWTQVVEHVLPAAKLLIRGRRQPIVLGPELQHAERFLGGDDVELRFDPAFARPLVDASSDAFWFLTRWKSAVCDGCGVTLARGSGWSVPAIHFRQSDSAAQWLVDHLGGGEFGLLYARRNWNGLLLCDSCAAEVGVGAR